MERVLTRVCAESLDPAELAEVNPFGARLVPIDIWKGAKFERSFVTTLGQTVFEQVAKIVAQGTGATAETQYMSLLTVCTFRLERIDSILRAQRENRSAPDWRSEVQSVKGLVNDSRQDMTVISDLFVRRPDGSKEFYTMKTVKPNLDQTERAKRDMLRLVAADETDNVFFALPYNPAGEGHPYREAGHLMPYKLFEMDRDPCVLIGSSFWNQVGQSETVYDELLSLFEHVGSHFSHEIRRRYLGL